eukprot:1305575-Rhodomonas_salina.1
MLEEVVKQIIEMDPTVKCQIKKQLTADRVVCHWLTREKGSGLYEADDVLEGMRLQYWEQFISAMHSAARTGTDLEGDWQLLSGRRSGLPSGNQ